MRMKLRRATVFNLAAAVIVPCLAIGVLNVLVRSAGLRDQTENGFLILGLFALSGFAFLVREFRLYAIPMAIVYFPLIYFVMLGFGLFFVGLVYRDFL